MNFRNLLLTTAAVSAAIGATAGGAYAQPLYDKVTVDLPYATTVSGTVLPPGKYVIRQMDDASGNSRVLMIYGNDGMEHRATAMTIPTLDNKTPEKTSVVLNHFGNDYYFNKVWIQGKNYGYEFPMPNEMKSREKEAQASTVAATYESTADKRDNTEIAAAQKAPAPTPAPEAVTAAPSPVAAPAPVQEAQNTPPPAPAPVIADNTPTPAPQPETNATPAMPHTAGNWLGLMLGGGMLSSAGMMLRKLRG